MTTPPALLALADRRLDVYSATEVAMRNSGRWIREEDYDFAISELRRTLATPSAGVEVEVPGLLGMSDLLRAYGVETRSFADQAIAEAAFKAGVAAGKRAMETSTPPQVEYDRGLIAKMLNALITFGDKLAGFTYRSINDQIALLRAAANRDAAGVHTGRASEAGDWVFVPRVPTKEMCRAGLAERHDDLAKSIYAAMIAAAPAPGGDA